MDELRHLGKPSNQPTDKVDLIDWSGQPITVRLECSEFTSLCPVTGQPDFAQVLIEYVPGDSWSKPSHSSCISGNTGRSRASTSSRQPDRRRSA